MNCNFCYW